MRESIIGFFESKRGKELLLDFYGPDPKKIETQKKRYLGLSKDFIRIFKKKEFSIFNAPGRSEIIGNHTDHNLGKVLAAGISLDAIAGSCPADNNKITVFSKNFERKYIVDLGNLAPAEKENATLSLIKGVACGIKRNGYKIGGFDACVESEVAPGSGMSSSACFEILIGGIINDFYNGGLIPPLILAKSGQFAENDYLKKPSGLMDQIACSFGGMVYIDFKDAKKPVIKRIKQKFDEFDYSIVILNTGGSHADFTSLYASIPREMKMVAGFFKKDYGRQIALDQVLKNIIKLRIKASDRSILRVLHFLKENERVEGVLAALNNKDITELLCLINQSGNSSWKMLQNGYDPSNPNEQGITLGLALTEIFLNKAGQGACRIHGGGFAGTILAFIHNDDVKDYIRFMQKGFCADSIKVLKIRQTGVVKLL